MSRLDHTLEIQKWIADNAATPDVIVARIERAEHEAYRWYVLQRLGAFGPKAVDDIDQIAELMRESGVLC